MSKLFFRYGAMGSGKTMQLLQTAYNYNQKNMNVIIIKPKVDEKGGYNIESRIGVSRQVDYIFPNKIKIRNKLQLDGISAILVDEAQFLSPHQIDELYEISKEENIPVMCYGLRCDFQGKGFSGASRLLEIADDIEELKTVCECGNKATFNLRYVDDEPTFKGSQVVIDGEESNVRYTSVCGDCFIKLKKKYESMEDYNIWIGQ